MANKVYGHMIQLRRPPRIKILEAISAIADGRIKELDNGLVLVASSDGEREYRVRVRRLASDEYEACSTDNGTRYRRYVGYPIVAYLMKNGIIPYNPRVLPYLKGVPWKQLNEKYKKYRIVEEIVLKERVPASMRSELEKSVSTALEALGEIRIVYNDKICD